MFTEMEGNRVGNDEMENGERVEVRVNSLRVPHRDCRGLSLFSTFLPLIRGEMDYSSHPRWKVTRREAVCDDKGRIK